MRTVSRRDFFRMWLSPTEDRDTVSPSPLASPNAPSSSETPQVAVIAGRHCLAYRGTLCRTCLERCPVEGAIVLTDFLPRVVPDLCTGCAVCAELCPAPTPAIRIVPASSAVSTSS